MVMLFPQHSVVTNEHRYGINNDITALYVGCPDCRDLQLLDCQLCLLNTPPAVNNLTLFTIQKTFSCQYNTASLIGNSLRNSSSIDCGPFAEQTKHSRTPSLGFLHISIGDRIFCEAAL